mmetsp:Transcript_1740/g.5577  ORF Transcript_1740/g.5577 Transcript_1740/m.5577 type:complete len:320 (+) Transcript_1740:1097-2056(+)
MAGWLLTVVASVSVYVSCSAQPAGATATSLSTLEPDELVEFDVSGSSGSGSGGSGGVSGDGSDDEPTVSMSLAPTAVRTRTPSAAPTPSPSAAPTEELLETNSPTAVVLSTTATTPTPPPQPQPATTVPSAIPTTLSAAATRAVQTTVGTRIVSTTNTPAATATQSVDDSGASDSSPGPMAALSGSPWPFVGGLIFALLVLVAVAAVRARREAPRASKASGGVQSAPLNSSSAAGTASRGFCISPGGTMTPFESTAPGEAWPARVAARPAHDADVTAPSSNRPRFNSPPPPTAPPPRTVVSQAFVGPAVVCMVDDETDV